MSHPLSNVIDSQGFIPHGHCYLWNPTLIWIETISNALIGVSYLLISLTLGYLIYKVRDLPFKRMYLAFGLFIISCGVTHFFDIWVIWDPLYWIDGIIRTITAIASVATALFLPFLIPKAVALSKAVKSAHEKGIQIETAYQQLGEIFEKTKQLDSLKTQFFSNVSHELRTPLTLIFGPVEKVLKSPLLNAKDKVDLELVLRNARILLKHVNDLLDVAKLEAKKHQPRYVEIDLSNFIQITAGIFEAYAKESETQFTIDTPKAVFVQADPDMIQKIILNLLSNAFKFTPPKGKIAIRLIPKNDNAVILVQDNGPGIPSEFRDAIFERFRQVDGGDTRKLGGTGLGLSIVKEFTELHHGNVTVSDSPGGGALFSVIFPIRAPKGVSIFTSEVRFDSKNVEAEKSVINAFSQMPKAPSQSLVEKRSSPSQRATILIVEDNREMNQFLECTLASDYHIVSAFDGSEGLEKTLSVKPDLVLSDVMMPRMSGDQLVKEIRSHVELNNIPIILLTAKADDELRARLLSEGAQDYLMKPFFSEELLARVKNQITIKLVRENLQKELSSQINDLNSLTREVTTKRQELTQFAEKLRIAKEEAERSSAVKTNFLNLVSHEMRTPLTSLQLYLEMLKRSFETAGSQHQKTLISKIYLSSRRSVELMDALLEYTRLQSGRIRANIDLFDLKALIQDITNSFKIYAQQKGIEILMSETTGPIPLIESDLALARTVIRNLIENAIHFTDRGTIQIILSFEKDEYRMSIRDTGIGISEKDQALLFQPFQYVGPLEKKSRKGIGLGLVISKEIAQMLGGRLEVVSKLGVGSTFTLYLRNLVKNKEIPASKVS